MRVYLNFTPRDGPYGGANSFLRTLMRELGRHDVTFTADEAAEVDVALVNALTEKMTLERVRALAERGIPVVHRKTGYRGRGTAELRAEVDGVVVGDALQVAFSPYLAHTIFQSAYSREVFEASGFTGPATVIPNGVDESVFNTVLAPRWRPPRPRSPWRPGEPVRVVVSTWSTDDSKGFPEYRRIDEALRGRDDIRLILVGRAPRDLRFGAIQVRRARPSHRLAELLKRQHVILQLTQWESCSNALIEGLNCGLPAVYLGSGANPEVAGPYGVVWDGDLREALDRLLPRYAAIVEALPENPYRISLVARRYLDVLTSVAR